MSNDEVKDCTLEEKVDLIRHGNRFCWSTFWVGIVKKIQNIVFSREFLVYVIYTVAMWKNDSFTDKTGLIVYTIVACVFILAESLKILIAERTTMQINTELKAGASVNKSIQESK